MFLNQPFEFYGEALGMDGKTLTESTFRRGRFFVGCQAPSP